MEETRYYYAEINSEGVCFNVIDSGVEMAKDSLISIGSYNITLLRKKYNNGTWEDIAVTSEPTDSEIFQAQTLLNQADIISKQSDMDKVMAEILLNQIGG